MVSKRAEILAGLFTLAGFIAIAYLAIQIGGARVGNQSYQLYARFDNVGGLGVGSAVRLGGVSVGEVTSVTIDREDYSAIVEMSLPMDLKLDEYTIASVRTNGLIGEKFLELSPGGGDVMFEAGEMITDTESAVNLESLISKMAFGGMEE